MAFAVVEGKERKNNENHELMGEEENEMEDCGEKEEKREGRGGGEGRET